MRTIIFDIETGPLPADALAAAIPPFDPMDVKLGNIKDPDKARAKIEEARASHVSDATARAALNAMTGMVLAIGIYAGNGKVRILGETIGERDLLSEFWNECRGDDGRLNELVGFNSNEFDLRFLIRRSLVNRVAVPFGLRKGRYWSDQCVDLRDAWALGEYQAKGSLGDLARALGCGEKSGSGAAFARLWVEDRPKAIEYLTNDVLLTVRVAEALGVIQKEGDY